MPRASLAVLLTALLALAWPGAGIGLPSGVADEASVSPGSSTLIDVLANDVGAGLDLVAVDAAGLGTAAVEGGSIRYDAPAGEGTDVFGYLAQDENLVPFAGVVTVAIRNAEPALLLGSSPSAPGHGGPVSLPGWATLDAGDPDESSQVLSAQVTDVGDPSLFDAGPDLAPNGTLTFTPHAGAEGTSLMTAVLSDDGPGNNTASAPFSITITDAEPKADVLLPAGVVPHALAAFFDATVDDGDLAWSWDFGDGNGSEEQHPVHSYERSGLYTVSLDVLDDAGQTSHADGFVEVLPSALVADFQLARRAPVGQPVQFEDASTGGEGPLSSHWTFGDGASADGASVAHTFGAAGTYTVRLTVSDAGGNDSMLIDHVTAYDAGGGLGATSPGNPVEFASGDIDVIFNARGAGGLVDYSFSVSPSISGLAIDSIADLTGTGRTALLYLEGQAGPTHESDKVASLEIVFHYGGLGVPASRLQPWYWTGLDWVRIPRSSTPYTVACVCPEGDQTFYGYTIDTGAQTLTVTAAHASVFGLAGSTGGVTGGSVSTPGSVESAPVDSWPAPSPDAPATAPAADGDDAAGAAGAGEAGSSPSPSSAGHLVATLPDGAPFEPGTALRQTLLLSWDGDEPVRYVLVAPDGSRQDLDGASWDPTGWQAGTYHVEAVGGPDGTTTLDSFAVVVPVSFSRFPAQTAVTAAAVSMAIVAGASLLSAASASVATIASQAASETAASMAEERFYESRLAKLINRLRRLKPGPAFATVVALASVTVFFAWAAAGSLAMLPSFLLTVGVPTVAMFGCCYALDWAIARASGQAAKLRLLGPGALALAISTLGFRTPVGNPALVDSESDEAEGAEGGDGARGPSDAALACASLLGYLSFAAPLWVASLWLGPEVAAVGNAAIVSILATGTLPIAPMTGSSLWHARKSAALLAWLSALGLYVGYAMGLVSDQDLALAGAVALPLFSGLLVSFVVSRRAVMPTWAAVAGRGLAAAGRAATWLIPSPLRRAGARMSKAWDAGQERIGQAVRRGLLRLMGRRVRAQAPAPG